jgi:hypothetical protein
LLAAFCTPTKPVILSEAIRASVNGAVEGLAFSFSNSAAPLVAVALAVIVTNCSYCSSCRYNLQSHCSFHCKPFIAAIPQHNEEVCRESAPPTSTPELVISTEAIHSLTVNRVVERSPHLAVAGNNQKEATKPANPTLSTPKIASTPSTTSYSRCSLVPLHPIK